MHINERGVKDRSQTGNIMLSFLGVGQCDWTPTPTPPLPPNPSKPFNIPYYFGWTTSQIDCHSNWRSHDYSGPSPLAVTFDAACFSVDRAFHWLAGECLSLGFDRFAICPLKCYKNVSPSQHTSEVNCNIWSVFSQLVWLYDLKSFKSLQQTWAFSP